MPLKCAPDCRWRACILTWLWEHKGFRNRRVLLALWSKPPLPKGGSGNQLSESRWLSTTLLSRHCRKRHYQHLTQSRRYFTLCWRDIRLKRSRDERASVCLGCERIWSNAEWMLWTVWCRFDWISFCEAAVGLSSKCSSPYNWLCSPPPPQPIHRAPNDTQQTDQNTPLGLMQPCKWISDFLLIILYNILQTCVDLLPTYAVKLHYKDFKLSTVLRFRPKCCSYELSVH